MPPQRALRPRQRPLHLRPQPLGRAVPVPVPVRPPRPLRPPERIVPLRAGLVGTGLQEAVPVQPLHVPLRPPDRAVPLPAGLVGQEVQLQVLLQCLALRAGDGQVRVPARLLGTGVPAALRLRARLLQCPHRPLHLRARLPGQELPRPLPGREIRISVRAQVRWGSRRDPAGLQADPALVSVPLAGQGDPSWGFEHPRLDAGSVFPQKKHLANASRKCHPKILSSLVPLPVVIKQRLPTQNIL